MAKMIRMTFHVLDFFPEKFVRFVIQDIGRDAPRKTAFVRGG